MATIPRGIQEISWTNKDSSITKKYKVRITRKGLQKQNKNFDDLEEAKEFLALSKLKKGQELIYKITEEERKKKEEEKIKKYESQFLESENYTFEYFVKIYIRDYVLTKSQDTELTRRNVSNILSFYKTILNTSIPSRYITKDDREEIAVDELTPVYIFIGGFDIRNIKAIEINLYIKERLKKVKAISVSREITHISNVFSKLQYFNENLADLQNPTRQYDKDLLKGRVTKREFSITEEEEKKLFELLLQKNNKQLFHIAKLSLLTSMRRSEIITLTKSQIKDNFVQLVYTKSGKPRKVYIGQEVKEYINSIPDFTKTDQFFTYTIAGFDRVFREFMQKNNLKHIHFHDLRRLHISKKLMEFGSSNSILLTEILGMQSIANFEKNHVSNLVVEPTDQKSAMANFGHSFSQTTKGYFNLPKIDIKFNKK